MSRYWFQVTGKGSTYPRFSFRITNNTYDSIQEVNDCNPDYGAFLCINYN